MWRRREHYPPGYTPSPDERHARDLATIWRLCRGCHELHHPAATRCWQCGAPLGWWAYWRWRLRGGRPTPGA